MFEREHGFIRRMVRSKSYVLTHHALDEMIADDLHVRDIENIIFNDSIMRREVDQQTQESKYVIFVPTTQGLDGEVVAKIKGNVVIITVYLL